MKSISFAAAIGGLIALAPLTTGQAFLIDPMGPNAGQVSLSGQDLLTMRSLAIELLDQAKPGESRQWRNDRSGNSGTMRLVSVYKSNGLDCRRILHTIKFKGFKDPRSFIVPYCKDGGRWRNAMR
jgi:surface antigen